MYITYKVTTEEQCPMTFPIPAKQPNPESIQVYKTLPIPFSLSDAMAKLQTAKPSPEIEKALKQVWTQLAAQYQPAAVTGCFDIHINQQQATADIIVPPDHAWQIRLGEAIQFLEPARQVFISIYTIGSAFTRASNRASADGNMMDAYLIDHIGLVALEKTGDRIKTMAEDLAKEKGWKVGPFLSPGSVHGWDIKEQRNICSLLPIDKIDVRINDDFTLFPFTSIASAIGLGPHYPSNKVGSTCSVCSKKNDCPMKQKNKSG